MRTTSHVWGVKRNILNQDMKLHSGYMRKDFFRERVGGCVERERDKDVTL